VVDLGLPGEIESLGNELRLTPEQIDIVNQSVESRTLVTATAGTGKTWTLAARVAALLKSNDVGPGQILVLSFSRAAAHAIRIRADSTNRARVVNVLTLDSFASKVLAIEIPDQSWTKLGYDARIDRAIALFDETEGHRTIENTFGDLQHVLIDEIQDLIGRRCELALRVLKSTNRGFTLFGDPAQAIYDFQNQSTGIRDTLTSFQRIRAEIDSVQVFKLTENFRALNPTLTKVLAFAPMLQAERPNYSSIHYDITSFIVNLSSINSLASARPLLARQDGTTAILCRDNAAALLISKELDGLGLSHRFQRDAGSRIAPRWVALLLSNASNSRITKTDILRQAEAALDSGVEPETAWSLLRSAAPSRAGDVDCRRLGALIRDGSLPDSFYETAASSLTVSTVHRAKGLEFDRVILCMDPNNLHEDADLGSETRVLFVALTRARRELYRLQVPALTGMKKMVFPDDRWVRFKFHGRRRYAVEIEIRGNDIDSTLPACALSSPHSNVKVTQEYIRDNVRAGDALRLELIADNDKASLKSVYALMHESHCVGDTSEYFNAVLNAALGRNADKWPRIIRDIRVEAIDSVAAVDLDTSAFGLGRSGIWLRVRPFGLGIFD
jgi:hypothetical protein